MLDCYQDKYKYNDVDASFQKHSKKNQEKRRNISELKIKAICNDYRDILCQEFDEFGDKREINEVCKNFNSCPDDNITLMDSYENFKEFYELLMRSFMFDTTPRKRTNFNKIFEMARKIKSKLAKIKRRI